MALNKNQSKDLFLVLLKTIFLIFGLNLFLTSLINGIKLELKKNNLESEMNLNFKKPKYIQKYSKYWIWCGYLLKTFSEVSSIDHKKIK